MKVRFLTIAQQEVDESFRFLEAVDEGLGYKFLAELDRIVRRIKRFPFVGFEAEPEIRRALLAHFSVRDSLRRQ